MNPYPKFGSDVEVGDTTHIAREQIKRAGRGFGIFMLVTGWVWGEGLCVCQEWPTCGLFFPLVPKEAALPHLC